jgi:hypothetical protein
VCARTQTHIHTHTVEEYNHYMGYIDEGNLMSNSYSISHCMKEWMKKLIFHLSDMDILNSYINLLYVAERKSQVQNFILSW